MVVNDYVLSASLNTNLRQTFAKQHWGAFCLLIHTYSLGGERDLKKPVRGQAATVAKRIAHLPVHHKTTTRHPTAGRDRRQREQHLALPASRVHDVCLYVSRAAV